ncbi:putative cell wall-binding domain [Desulfitobacterium sp. LBE]|uniref:cell wall-binding repeat-containing protein n=1 Tax=Desulfitobacterium sp. LBE TaxID=884086 RepID=UPI00119C2326|nr:cell wall-binding repeat-containing protein [Desulfitobacterium sp. LBE]TWH59710.1 putative cell wall-binding domain [Desulfitobacterium sp. LBE]
MNKTKKALASLAIAGMVLSMAPVSVFAADEDTRLAGADRYLTSIKIAEKAYASADTAVVAAGNPNNLVDALAAAPLAAQEDAPIYLTDKADMNDDVVKSMKALGVDKVIVVGAAASKAVVDELKAAGFSVEEVKGAGRVETAEAINKKLTAPAGTFVVGYDGVADAMSVASYAAANNYAIVVANQNGTPNGTVDADYIVGGTARVKDIAGAKRLAGADRYDTNKQVIAELDFDFGTVYVGNGLTLADALVGSVLAAQTNSPIALTDGKTVKADIASNLDADSVVVALGGTAAVSNAVIDAVKNPPSTGEFKVESIKASAANAIKVNFSKAPADVEKVTFTVENAGTALTPTVNWNEAKTEATLAYSANYPNGNYTVKVVQNDKELATKELTFEQQKVAKIEITSDVLSVDPMTGLGYATYQVTDQYGVDITYLPLANNITWQPGIGAKEKEPRDGVIIIKPLNNIPLLTYQTAVITAYDTNSFVTTTATLSVSQSAGTISKLTLNKLYSLNDDEFSTSNTTGQWYIDYTALDASGNPTTSYELIKSGLLLNQNSTTFNAGPFLIGEVVQDPKDNKKAAISIKLDTTNISTLVSDMQIPINIILKNGQTANLNVTLNMGSRVESITLYSPTDTVSSEEEVTIPFVAYDQKGKKITSYTKLNGKLDVNISNTGSSWDLVADADGSARLLVDVGTLPPNTNSMPVYVTATVKATGKTSQLNINVQKKAEAATLSIDSGELVQAMQLGGATQEITFNSTSPELMVKDQYGRKFDMVAQSDYKVVAKTTGSAIKLHDSTVTTVPTTEATSVDITGTAKAKVTSVDAKSQVVTFELVKAATGEVIDSRNYSFIVVRNQDIVDYTLESVNKLYIAPTAFQAAYTVEADVFGKLNNGAKVVLAETVNGNATVQGASTTNTNDFNVSKTDTGLAVYAKTNGTVKSATGKATVTVYGTDERIYSISADLTSSDEAPVVESVSYTASKTKATVTNDRISIAQADLNGSQVVEYDKDGNKQSGSNFYFSGKDQYGKKAAELNVYVSNKSATGLTVSVDPTTKVISVSGGASGDSFTLTAVAGSGASKAVVITLK